jgi:hypothetical protein
MQKCAKTNENLTKLKKMAKNSTFFWGNRVNNRKHISRLLCPSCGATGGAIRQQDKKSVEISDIVEYELRGSSTRLGKRKGDK